MTPWLQKIRWCIVGIALSMLSIHAWTQVSSSPSKTASEPRLALLIGNSTYRSQPLVNAIADVRLMASSLRSVGFEVVALEDANLEQMLKAVNIFSAQLTRRKGVGLFYFAGHGMQLGGDNFLIPIDGTMSREEEVRARSLNAQEVLDKMRRANNRLSLVFFDACRDNPFPRSTRSASSGLARMDASLGMLIAYATAPGAVAEDGRAGNSPFTRHLATQLREPGQRIEDVLKRVRTAVREETKGRQITWDNSALEGDFFFVAADAQAQPLSNGSSSAALATSPTIARPQVTARSPAPDPAAQAMEEEFSKRFKPLLMSELKTGDRFYIDPHWTSTSFVQGVGVVKNPLEDAKGKVITYQGSDTVMETVWGKQESRPRLIFSLPDGTTLPQIVSPYAAEPQRRQKDSLDSKFIPLGRLNDIKQALVGQTVYPTRPGWSRDDDKWSRVQGARRFVPLKVIDVMPGGAGNQALRIVFDAASAPGLASGKSGERWFFFSDAEDLMDDFRLTDPRTRHGDVRESAWDAIELARPSIGLTQTELILAIGQPQRKQRTERAEGVVEVWNYYKRRITIHDGQIKEIEDLP